MLTSARNNKQYIDANGRPRTKSEYRNHRCIKNLINHPDVNKNDLNKEIYYFVNYRKEGDDQTSLPATARISNVDNE